MENTTTVNSVSEVKNTNWSVDEIIEKFPTLDYKRIRQQYAVIGRTCSKSYAQLINLGQLLGENLNNNLVDMFTSIQPERRETENREQYHNRLKIQKILSKYRSIIYQQEDTPKRYSAKRTKKLKAKLGL